MVYGCAGCDPLKFGGIGVAWWLSNRTWLMGVKNQRFENLQKITSSRGKERVNTEFLRNVNFFGPDFIIQGTSVVQPIVYNEILV